MNKTTAIAFVITIVLVNGFFSINAIESNKQFFSDEVGRLLEKNTRLQDELKEFYKYGVSVDVTMYQPTHYQTDSSPNITADGTRFRISKASEYKFVALSRNLLKRWGGIYEFKDFILIRGTKDKDGIYQIRDTMNSRFVNTVDILESVDVKPYKYYNAQIFKINL